MRVTHTRSEIYNALVKTYTKSTDDRFNFERLKVSHQHEGCERLKCLQDYFKQELPNNDVVEMELIQSNASLPDSVNIVGEHVVLTTEKMESIRDPKGVALVDFANANLHIHSIIPSCTQEEILFSTHSECFIGLLYFRERLADDQVIVFRNVWRHCDYTGYAKTFEFQKQRRTEPMFDDIIAMDACEVHQHYQTRRDVIKAWIGFQSTTKDIIVTGKWGCGVFGGDPILKFVQQIIAAQLAKKKMVFCSFGESLERYKTILSLIQEVKPTIEWLIEKMEHPLRETYYEHMKEQLELAQLKL